MRIRNAYVVGLIASLVLGGSAIAAGTGEPGPMRFEPNRGQADPTWAFVARSADGAILVGERELRVGSASLILAGADTAGVWESAESVPGRAHYLLGAERARWVVDVPLSTAVRRHALYPGIDVVVRTVGRRVGLEFTVASEADASLIALELDGPWRPDAPVVDGEPGSFRAVGKLLRVDVPQGSRSAPMRIEVSAELTETSAAPEPPRLAADPEGNLYLAGRVSGSAATTYVTQLDPSGKTVLRTTYLDGLDQGSPVALAVARSGEVLVAGTQAGTVVLIRVDRTGREVIQRTNVGAGDALAVAADANGDAWIAASRFVSKVAASGAVLFAVELDGARAIAVDPDGDAYVTGARAGDAFVAKIDRSGSIAYATTIGGSGDDEGAAIAVSQTKEAVVTGTTRSSDFPIAGGLQSSPLGGSDAFLARLDASGRVEFSTYLGGADDDRGESVALDRQDVAWIATSRRDEGESDGVVYQLSLAKHSILDEDVIAGQGTDVASGVLVDGNGDGHVAGFTTSDGFSAASLPESTRGAAVFLGKIGAAEPAPLGTCPGSKNFDGNVSNAWEVADNWNTNTLPAAGDSVCIQGFNVVLGGGSSVGSVRVEGGSLTISSSGSLTVAGASEFTGTLTLAGTLTGAGNRTTSGSFNFTGGTLGGAGITTSTGPVSISGTAAKGLFAHRWDINANVTWTGTGSFGLSSSSIVNTTATWDCQSDATLTWPVGSATAVNNSGTFKKSAGAGTSAIQAPFYNTGSVLIQTGQMNLTAGGSSTGSFDVPAGRTLQLGGGTYSFDAETTFTGAGNVLLSAATLNVNPAVTVTIPAAMTFDMSGGILQNTGTLTVEGPLNWTGGTMQHGGVTTCNGPLNISGTVAKGIQLGRTLNNNATCNYTATGAGNLGVSSTTVINNTGTWDFQGDGSVVWGVGTAPPFNNSGTLKKSSGAGTSTVSVPFNNTGVVLVQTGTLNTSGGGTSSGSFDISSGTTLQYGGSTYNWNAGTVVGGSGRVLLSSTILNVNAAVTIPASMTFDLAGGTLASTGTLTVNGPFNWTAGGMEHGGVTTCNGTLNISGTVAKGIQLGRTLNNNATCNYTATGTGNLSVSSATVINNTGTWDIQGDGSINWGVGTAPPFNNSGTLKKSSGAGTSSLTLPFVNTGSVLVQTGTLSLTGGGSSAGGFDIAAPTTLLFNGNSFNLDAGNVFTGLGTITLGAATWNVNAAIAIPAPITFNMSSTTATMNGSGTLTTFGLFNWTAGSFGGNGATTSEGPMTISTTASKGIGGRALNTNNTTTWSGAGTTIGLSFAGIINNNGTWEVLNDATMSWGVGGAPAFKNFGTFRKSVGVGTTTLNLPFQNQGTVDIQSGTISSNNYSQTAGTTKLTGGALSSAVNIQIQGGTLTGTGTVTGPVVVSGTGALSPGLSAGTLAIAGNYTQQAPNGAFNVEIGGLTPGTQHDRANLSGTSATLAGVLNVTLIGGFVPLPGDSFTIMSYPATRTGTFTLNLPSVGCIGWRVNYGTTALVLTAAAVPAEVASLTMTSKTAMSWAAAPIYANTSYNVLRGDLDKLPVGPGADETCVVPSTAATTGSDANSPLLGKGFWYLVRETVFGCGPGTYGFRTGGTERISTACP